MKAAIGHAFLDWGGFAPLQPLYEASPFASQVPTSDASDRLNIRFTLNKWSQILDRPDPSFSEMQAERGNQHSSEPSLIHRFSDAVTRAMSSCQKTKGQQPPKQRLDIIKSKSALEGGWEPLKDYKVKSKK